jgi:peroxin-5
MRQRELVSLRRSVSLVMYSLYSGLSHAENDEDRKAIVCLQRAVDADPYNIEALLALGVSYVNELDNHKALMTLKTWIQHNPKFHGLKIESDAYSDGSLLDEVQHLMLKAKAWETGDSDVLEVLGVLYNVSHDYTNAVDAFRSALDASPDNYALWNKLGATLANGSMSVEALAAYENALAIKPRYARGWLNVGISHANLGNYKEAAAAYLQALALNRNATHIWSYLRIALTQMDRYDLVKKTDLGDVALFRSDFSFEL